MKTKSQIKYIYKLINPDTNEPFYVGQTLSLEKRLYQHINESSTNPNNVLIIKALKKNGLEPVMKIIEIVVGKNANRIEEFWIRELSRTHKLTNRPLKNDYTQRNKKKQYLFTVKCSKKQLKEARRLLNSIKKQTNESHAFIILRALRSIEKSGQIDY